MSDHPRKAIRKAIAAMLQFKTDAQDRVYTTRQLPWKRQELPAIAVYSNEEDSEEMNLRGDLKRDATVAILIAVDADDLGPQVDDTLDDLAWQVEGVLKGDPSLQGAAVESHLSGTHVEFDNETGQLLGAARLTYAVRYHT